MRPEAQKYLWDVQEAAKRISRFAAGKTFEGYLSDEMLRSAVERQFEIIGEALNRLAQVDPAIAGRIAELPRIVAFRNVLIHGYATIDDRLVWGTVEGQLPGLLAGVSELLKIGD